MGKLVRIKNYIQKNGLSKTLFACAERVLDKKTLKRGVYERWQESEITLDEQRKHRFERNIKFSVIVPAYHTNPEHFCKMVDSVVKQTYKNWELIIGDAGENNALKNLIPNDKRIIYFRIEENRGISENTNQVLKLASGDFVCLLDHDDFVEPSALYEMMTAIEEADGREVIAPLVLYTDEDKCDGAGVNFFEPNYKLDFNLDHLLSNNYICHFLCMKTELIKRLMLRKEYDGAQDYDLILRAVLNGGYFIHINKVLYHWRCHEESTASNPQSKMYAYEAGKKALQNFIIEKKWNATVEHSGHLGFYKIKYKDIWRDRPEILAITGPVYKHGRMVGGALNKNGQILYEGTPYGFGGYMHRIHMARLVDGVMKEYAVYNPNPEGANKYLYDPDYRHNTKL